MNSLPKRIVLMAYILLCSIPVLCGQQETLWKTFPNKKHLDNGLTIICEKDGSSAITVVQILIKGGKRAEPEGKQGLAYLTTRLVLEIPDQTKLQEIMNQATHISMDCRNDYSIINLECLSENLEDTLKLMTDIMLKPVFSGTRIENIKKQMNQRRKIEEDDAVQAVHNYCLEIFFANTAYADSVYGSQESLKSLKGKDIKNFYKDHFITGNMVVSVSSDLDEVIINRLFEKYFTKFLLGNPPEINPFSITPTEEKNHFVEKETKQSLVAIAYPLPKISTRNFCLAFMLENLLGKGVNSRLWPLRKKEKLAYNVNSKATQLKEAGILEVYLETDNAKKDIAVDALKKVLRNLYENGISEEELNSTKNFSQASFLRNNERKENRSHSLISFEALGLGFNYLNRLFLEIDAVSLEEMNDYIKEVLDPEKGVEIIIGPQSTI